MQNKEQTEVSTEVAALKQVLAGLLEIADMKLEQEKRHQARMTVVAKMDRIFKSTVGPKDATVLRYLIAMEINRCIEDNSLKPEAKGILDRLMHKMSVILEDTQKNDTQHIKQDQYSAYVKHIRQAYKALTAEFETLKSTLPPQLNA